jgi:hypothetical protein
MLGDLMGTNEELAARVPGGRNSLAKTLWTLACFWQGLEQASRRFILDVR